jgi:hypothetical protein
MKKHETESKILRFDFPLMGSLFTLPVPFAPLFFNAISHFDDSCKMQENTKDCVNHISCGSSTNEDKCYNMGDCEGNANLNDCDNVGTCTGNSNPEGCNNAGNCGGSSNDGGNFITCDNCHNSGACPPEQITGPFGDLINGHGPLCIH